MASDREELEKLRAEFGEHYATVPGGQPGTGELDEKEMLQVQSAPSVLDMEPETIEELKPVKIDENKPESEDELKQKLVAAAQEFEMAGIPYGDQSIEDRLLASPAKNERQELEMLRAQLLPQESLGRQLGRSTIEALPIAGALTGGAVGAASGLFTGGPAAPFAAVTGAGLGMAGGESLKNFLKTVFFPEEAPTTKEVFTAPVEAGIKGAAYEAGGAAAIGAFSKGLGWLGKTLFAGEKATANEIIDAAQRLGVKPTQGMLTEGKVVPGLESSLTQSPSLAGAVVRSEVNSFNKGLTNQAEKLVSVPRGLTKFEVGNTVKGGLAARAGESVQQAEIIYNDLDTVFKNVAIFPKAIKNLKSHIARLPAIKLFPRTSKGGSLARKIFDDLDNIKTVQDARAFRTNVYKLRTATMSPAEKEIIDEVYHGLTRVRNNSILKNMGGRSAARENLLANLKEADSIYKKFFDEIKPIEQALGGKISKTPQQFLDKLQDIPEEVLVDKLFNIKKFGELRKLKELFPEEFEILKNSRIDQLAEKSMFKGQISPTKLVKNLSNIGKEVREIMFGKQGEKALKDLKTLTESIPEKIGPSGTPQGLEYTAFGGPISQLSGLARLIGLKGAPHISPLARSISETTAIPSIQSAFGQSLIRKSFGNNERRKQIIE